MHNLKSFEIWFLTGSQHLYGPETLKQVDADSVIIANHLDSHPDMPVKVVFKPVLKSTEEILNICKEANHTSNCIGVVIWMHTFSPSKMWIGGLKILQVPLLHLHTQ
ncbi:MAG TPA: L-arabinose isomerase, partial [Saprospiraceae bacterium]|nr:L-arabinose isomerase [Saprospiraceae bacterium]